MWPGYQYEVPKEKKIRYIICSDAKNEADDQFTIAHILMTDKLDVKGIIAGHFNICGKRYKIGQTTKASYDEIIKILDLMHLAGRYPVYMGATLPLKDPKTPIMSEGANFIIEEAMKNDERPLFIGMQGSVTDLAAAILMKPEICERMTAIWIGGGSYPSGGDEFNLLQDINAANVLSCSCMPLWQIPKTAYRQFTTTLSELQVRVRPYGKIGRYLFEQMIDVNRREATSPNWPNGESWTMGDEGVVAVLLDDQERTDNYTIVPAPYINPDMSYLSCNTNRKIRVYHKMSVHMTFEDLFAKLKINFPEEDS